MHKTVKIPGPDHPITIAKSASHVVVSVAGHKIADSTDALSFHEAAYPEVLYIPRKDVDMSLLERTDHSTYCPYKGECSYYSIPAGGERSINAVWSYESPYEAVESEYPYAASALMLDDRSRAQGKTDYRRNLDTYAECLLRGTWPSYSQEVQLIDLPAWAMSD